MILAFNVKHEVPSRCDVACSCGGPFHIKDLNGQIHQAVPMWILRERTRAEWLAQWPVGQAPELEFSPVQYCEVSMD